MKILFVSPEVAPLARTGGLGDVVGALPLALKALGADVRVLCPLHRSVSAALRGTRLPGEIRFNGSPKQRRFRIRETRLPEAEVPVYLIEHKQLFDRPGIYAGPGGDHPDNHERAFALCQAALALPEFLRWFPNIHHAHDWMAAPLPAFLNTLPPDVPTGKAASVLTIHNLEHQGVFPPQGFALSGLPSSYFRLDGFEHYGNLNLLKGGIQHADKITTVSPTYSEEIKTETHGHGLHPALLYRAADLVGVLNGIDVSVWNPKTDPALPRPFSAHDAETGKTAARHALSRELGLPHRPKTALFGVVSRLYSQKGLDLLAQALPALLEKNDFQLALLGSGAPAEEQAFLRLAERFPQHVAARIGFDEALARLIFAASHFFLMPSRFEPCGLAQQYAMSYGALPIARHTGGLADTIIDPTAAPSKATGLLFEQATSDTLAKAISRALSLHARPARLARLRHNAMNRPASWTQSARQYLDLYQWAVDARKQKTKST